MKTEYICVCIAAVFCIAAVCTGWPLRGESQSAHYQQQFLVNLDQESIEADNVQEVELNGTTYQLNHVNYRRYQALASEYYLGAPVPKGVAGRATESFAKLMLAGLLFTSLALMPGKEDFNTDHLTREHCIFVPIAWVAASTLAGLWHTLGFTVDSAPSLPEGTYVSLAVATVLFSNTVSLLYAAMVIRSWRSAFERPSPECN